MSIQSNYEYKGATYDKVIFKIVRVFGSKLDGWNAVFAFVEDGEEFEEKNFKGLISLGAPWSDANPYPIMYGRMEELLSAGSFSFTNDLVITRKAAPVVKDETVAKKESKPKKPRIPKVKKEC